MVLDPDTLLLEYSLGARHSYLWVVSQTSLTSYELANRADVEAASRLVYEHLTARQPVHGETDRQYRARVKKSEAEYPQASAALSRMLLGSASSQLGTKRLLIVADGPLQFIPFAALPVPTASKSAVSPTQGGQLSPDDGRPLILEHEIINLPSASALAVLRQETSGREPAAKAVIVVADPVFDKDDPRVKLAGANKAEPGEVYKAKDFERAITDVGMLGSRGTLLRLPFSREEAEAVTAFAPLGQGAKALDFKANRATVTGPELSQYRIVHFATHGLLEQQAPGVVRDSAVAGR